jgi:hypothetical protein
MKWFTRSLKCYKQRFVDVSGEILQEKNYNRYMDNKTVIIKFQTEIKTVLEIGLEAINVIFWEINCLLFVHVVKYCGVCV